MFNKLFNSAERLKIWYRKNRGYRLSRKISDYRAISLAERLVRSGSLQGSRLTGAPMTRGGK